MSVDTVTLDRFDYDRLTSFTGLTYALLDQLEAVLPLLDANCEQPAAAERAIAVARKALSGEATPKPADGSPARRFGAPTGSVSVSPRFDAPLTIDEPHGSRPLPKRPRIEARYAPVPRLRVH
jgi:hypothetical protein